MRGFERMPDVKGTFERPTCVQCKGAKVTKSSKGETIRCSTCNGTGKMPRG